MSATGAVTAGSFSGTTVSATGAVTAGSFSGTTVSATGAVTAGSFSGTTVSATGTVTAGSFSGTTVSATGSLALQPTSGSVGIGKTNPSYTLEVVGSLGVTGDISALYSDDRLKTRLAPIDHAMDKVSRLSAFTYRNNALASTFGFADDIVRVGLSAQEVAAVLPEAVTSAPFDATPEGTSLTGDRYLTVRYERIVPLLVAALHEVRGRLDATASRSGTVRLRDGCARVELDGTGEGERFFLQNASGFTRLRGVLTPGALTIHGEDGGDSDTVVHWMVT